MKAKLIQWFPHLTDWQEYSSADKVLALVTVFFAFIGLVTVIAL